MTEENSKLRFVGESGPLFKAMAEARKHFKSLVTSAEADVTGTSKTGKAYSYSFSYAPLDVVLGAIEPGLQAAGLALSQPFDGKNLYTIVAFEGSMMVVETSLPGWSDPQALGSLLTYIRRYQIKGVFGVADSEDDDGGAAAGNQTKVTRKEPPPAPKREPTFLPDQLRLDINNAAKAKKLSKEQFVAFVQESTGCEWPNLTPDQGEALLMELRK